MIRETATDILDYCRRELGESLRAVTAYGPDTHEPIYTRAGVNEQIKLDEETRSMFRSPLVQMQKAVWQLADVHPTLDEPAAAIYAYGDVSVIQIPISWEEGVIVTIDAEGPLPDDFASRCESIVDGLKGTPMV